MNGDRLGNPKSDVVICGRKLVKIRGFRTTSQRTKSVEDIAGWIMFPFRLVKPWREQAPNTTAG